MNSSRNYIKIVSDRLDDKRKMVFSSHLRKLDQAGLNLEEQNNWKNLIAREAQKYIPKDVAMPKAEEKGAESDSQRHSA
jgi:hypothetical protein